MHDINCCFILTVLVVLGFTLYCPGTAFIPLEKWGTGLRPLISGGQKFGGTYYVRMNYYLLDDMGCSRYQEVNPMLEVVVKV
jgi:hypothetical protein